MVVWFYNAMKYVSSLKADFEKVVDKFGDRPAIFMDDKTFVSYSSFDKKINNFCALFVKNDIKRKDVICIRLHKNTAAYAAAMACVKLGITFCFVDPLAPHDRVVDIIELCEPSLILDDINNEKISTKVICIYIDSDANCIADLFFEELNNFKSQPTDPAYIVFTSGSTGRPKGVTITHSNLQHFINWAVTEYTLSETDIHTHINPIYFDNSIFDIFSTFYSGASIVPFSVDECKKPYHVVDKIKLFSCNIFFGVPSMLRFLINMKSFEKGELSSLQKIIFGGEGYPLVQLKQLFNLTNSHAKLFNVYGPSECSCICSSYQISENDFFLDTGLPPIGFLSDNFDLLLLDEKDVEVFADKVGELCLGGPCVGVGYYNQPDLSVKKFITNPSEHRFMQFFYRTGDLFKLNSDDGKLYFIGRKDFQIKHQGYRIELEEIEIAASRLDGILDVCCWKSSSLDEKLILNFESTGVLSINEIAEELKKKLPSYMVPQSIIQVQKIPKNANGKTDRSKLEKTFENKES